jgi:hypothetical protein
MAQIWQIPKKKKVFRFPDSYDKLHYVAMNLDKFVFFLQSYLVCNEIWLNHLMGDRYFKIGKRNPACLF